MVPDWRRVIASRALVSRYCVCRSGSPVCQAAQFLSGTIFKQLWDDLLQQQLAF